MEDAAHKFKAKVTGHTHVIAGPEDQPGKKSLKPGEKAGWGDTEGNDSWVELPDGIVHDTGRLTKEDVNGVKGGKTKVTERSVAKKVADAVLLGPPGAIIKDVTERFAKLAWNKLFGD